MYRLIAACVLALVVALAGTALTKTPDKQPPSTETACTGLFGAARGLCNAYCQAQDCDVHERPSCANLRKQFQKQTGSAKFPCDRVACGQSAPTCDGECPTGFVCASGVENGGSEGGGESGGDTLTVCSCAVPCGNATAPQCGGACPSGSICASGPESGGSEGGSEGGPEAGTCSCQTPCGDATAPACDGACPNGAVCSSGAEGGPENGGSEGGPEGDACVCRF
jgi:hypothetical protein